MITRKRAGGPGRCLRPDPPALSPRIPVVRVREALGRTPQRRISRTADWTFRHSRCSAELHACDCPVPVEIAQNNSDESPLVSRVSRPAPFNRRRCRGRRRGGGRRRRRSRAGRCAVLPADRARLPGVVGGVPGQDVLRVAVQHRPQPSEPPASPGIRGGLPGSGWSPGNPPRVTASMIGVESGERHRP